MRSAASIADVLSWEALDSRGNPTVACEVKLLSGASGVAAVPSGKSAGSHEAAELRDGDAERYGGMGVANAVANVRGALRDAVIGLDATHQVAVDERLTAADGSERFARLGANASLAVSVATAIAGAAARRRPLYDHVSSGEPPLMPMPMVNIISGGAHATDGIDIQDLLVVPLGAESFPQAIEWAARVRRCTAEWIEQTGLPVSLVADEGGIGSSFATNRAALDALFRGIERSGLEPGVDAAIALDVAASQLTHDGCYALRSERRILSADDLISELLDWCERYPIVSIEDPVGEDDWDGWRLATHKLSGRQLLGDDLFATDPSRIARGIAESVANAVLVKPNQNGTLSGAREALDLARRAGYRTVLSARSGETEDSWLADLAIGWTSGQIKVGSTMRSERTAKWNRLLQIASGTDIPFADRRTLELVSG